jgi:hypothetical protein
VQSSEERTSDFDISVISENRDTSEKLGALRDYVGTELPIGEDVSVRGRIGNRRAYGIQFQFNNISGRPRIRLIEANGLMAFKSLKKAQ